jgi:hypothetical protein
LTGSIFSAIKVSVSNKELNSVVTEVASMTVDGVIDRGEGFVGDVSATYLLPNTVVALTAAATLDGISLTYPGVTLSTTLAAGLPSRVIAEMVDTRPIWTPLKVTLEPGAITRPARGTTIVNFVVGVRSPRNCRYRTDPTSPMTTSVIRPTVLYGGRRPKRPRSMILRP